jgi:hypothetical protein
MNSGKNILTILLIGVLILLISIIFGIFINKQLEGPELCRSCHEMLPYYNSTVAPQNGSIISSHSLSCIQCHANKSLNNARKDILIEIIVYYLNISGRAFPSGDLKPDCMKCHVPESPVHKTLNQTNCVDCHWAHGSIAGSKVSNISLGSVIPYGPHMNNACKDCHDTNFELPQCIKCHSGHGEQKLENNLCLSCHTDAHVPKIPGILRNNTVKFTGNMPFSVCEPCHEEQLLNISKIQTAHKDMGTCTLCHQFHGEIPKCSKCHTGMMVKRHPTTFRCKTCHATFDPNKRTTCQDCHGRTHEWSAFTAVINPK